MELSSGATISDDGWRSNGMARTRTLNREREARSLAAGFISFTVNPPSIYALTYFDYTFAFIALSAVRCPLWESFGCKTHSTVIESKVRRDDYIIDKRAPPLKIKGGFLVGSSGSSFISVILPRERASERGGEMEKVTEKERARK